ncbi:hypothetical protein BGW41_007143 [Actinomortierella wolfii]|nr:hypothetical protein BGW41_007143 [Actinomortierella wolfii]
MRITTRAEICRICTTLVLATSVLATAVYPDEPPFASHPPHNPERPDVAAHSSSPMRKYVVERRELLGGILPLNPKSPEASEAGAAPPAPAPASPAASAPAAGAAVPPPPSSPADPNNVKTANSGVLPGLLNGVLSPPQASGTANSTTTSAPTTVHKPAATDANGDGVPDRQQQGNTHSSSSPNPKQSDNDHSSNTNNSVPAGVIALIVLFGLAVVGALLYSCYRIRQARHRRRTRRFDDEDILRGHGSAVGYSDGGGYGVYIEKERNNIWSRNLDIFHR